MPAVRLGHLIVEPDRHCLVDTGTVHRITPREMAVLVYLMEQAPNVVSREEMLETVWEDVVVNDEALTLVISRLRAVMADNPRAPRFIETIPKKGYRLMVEPVMEESMKRATVPKRTGRVLVAVLTLLLIVMTALFTIVRIAYEQVGP